MHEGSRRAVIAALFANLGIAIAKFAGFAFTGASSMLAEAIHSCADTGNQALLLWGGSRGRLEPTPRHPFGYGRERYFWAFVVALMLFTLGGLFAIYEGSGKLLHPHAISSPTIAIAILLLGIVLEGYSFRTAIVEARKQRGGHSWWEFIRHTKSAELPVVLLEDLGALLGLTFAMIGILLSMLTGDARYDAMGSIAIGVLLVGIAAVLAVEMQSLLIGESASLDNQQAIRSSLESSEHLSRIIHMRTLHLGPEELLVAAKVEFDEHLDLPAVARAIDAAEARVREAVPAARVIYLEPDVYRSRPQEGGAGHPTGSRSSPATKH
jgi:cation diffusion facilitator family transporter